MFGGEIIAPIHASFVPGRQRIDNVIICQEIMYTLRYTKANRGGLVIKLDLEKAYDSMEWKFIEETLWDVRLPNKLVAVIMKLTSSSCRLLNEEVTDVIKQTRGLRKGDPLSPYIFVLCMERLGHLFQNKV